MNMQDLASRPIEELRHMAAQYSLLPHHKAKAETIAKMIMEHITAKPERDPMQHEATRAAAPVYDNSPDEVREAIKKFLAKDGYTADFPDDGTWIFKYKGAEESGNLAIPLRVIVQKAESVSRGKRVLRGIAGDALNGTYADSILMVS